ncbi:MAG TPA: hydrogenase formation protein HypD [Planktothrix sp.]
MSYQQDFAKSEEAQRLIARIRATVTRPWKIMEMCGAHTHSILEYGIDQLLPKELQLLHGPGCAICFTPLEVIDRAFAIACLPDVIFCVYGELLKVPGTSSDFLDARASGADLRVVYSPLECITIAQENPNRSVVFFAVGSDKSAPLNAAAVRQAERLGLRNYFVLSCQAHIPPICSAVLQRHGGTVSALLGPGDGCSIIGFKDFENICREYRLPVVITGFEPLDLLEGILRCVTLLENGKFAVENQFTRSVTRAGNLEDQTLLQEYFQPGDFSWRRLGEIKNSGYRLKAKYAAYDAWENFRTEPREVHESPVCISDLIMLGQKKPFDCPAFCKTCTPQHAIGATMVSSEGTCSLYYKFRSPESERLKASEQTV